MVLFIYCSLEFHNFTTKEEKNVREIEKKLGVSKHSVLGSVWPIAATVSTDLFV